MIGLSLLSLEKVICSEASGPETGAGAVNLTIVNASRTLAAMPANQEDFARSHWKPVAGASVFADVF